MPENENEGYFYVSLTTRATGFDSIEIEDGEIKIHATNRDSTAYMPFLIFSLDTWDDLVTRVTALRETIPN